MTRLCRELLAAVGEDPDRPGLAGTPARFAAWWSEFLDYDPGRCDTRFEAASVDQMVVVSGMRVWSLCEHHLLPFWCDVTVGYLPRGALLGLSKFARIAHAAAHRLTVQEALVQEVADRVAEATGSGDVGVIGQGVHYCMAMRGVRTNGLMTTSVMRGAFRDQPAARSELIALAARVSGGP